ncbi:hypothetical protein CNMCM5793_007544 [Aspergillus hiratsukae]|uniref:L-type lectin-like domain-containing protein n=1 Tax=Aspergillus hiratsukae TaxID=1194566 RepID=A0A8H6UDD8_9EURO|nr:hypothetical protein CNMCM5793_007544 [Aspergillus hiratsukae]KAF7166372.1 hypothetical protein CNMCM6106_002199 [Aspergillus hiratsukae]
MRSLASLSFLVAAATAQSVIESASFGYGQTISPDRDSIPGWQVGGEGHTPQILSNKLILTPPYPGNTRGYAWSQSPLSQPEWSAEFQFRATGIERGGGNLQLWYVKDGQSKIGSSSIYTAGQFDGFALVIDTHGGRGGSIRGFLNDGTTDYKSHRSVDSLAFGHCDYAYRNLGRPSIVRLKHTNSVLEVAVDDKLCFSTNKVALPTGNNFGITAATPENPDSFEIFKFVVQSSPSGTNAAPPAQPQANQQPIVNQGRSPPVDTRSVNSDQLVDLSNRIQGVARDLSSQSTKGDNRHVELLQKLATKDQVANLDARLQKIEQLLQNIQRDLEGKDYRDRFNQLHETLRSSHMSLSENLQSTLLNVITASTPRMGFFICLVIAVQLLLAGSYIIYKRRRANMPKKFL